MTGSIILIVAGILALAAVWFFFRCIVSLFRCQWGGAFSHLALAILLIVFAGMILPAVTVGHDPPSRTKCMSNLSQLGKAMKMYARDHGGQYPSSFLSFTNYMNNPKVYVCSQSGKKVGSIETVDEWADYTLVTNLTENSSNTLVHAYCKPGNHRDKNGIAVLFVDGSVQWISEVDFGKLTCDVLKGSRINNMDPQHSRED